MTFTPVLAKNWAQKKRNLFFFLFAAGIGLVAFLILALVTQNVFVTVLLTPILAIGGAYALVGFPHVARKDGKPLVEAKVKPYLFFLLFPLFAVLLYPIVGTFATQAGLPPDFVAIPSILLALIGAASAAYFLVGFPPLIKQGRDAYNRIEPERRPFLFYPLFVIFFLIIYLALGVTTTRLMGRVADDPTSLLNWQVILVLPLSVVGAAALAYAIAGFPTPKRRARDYLPTVTGKRRPRYFLLTTLLLTLPFMVIIGALLTPLSKTGAASGFLPPSLVLPLALVLGAIAAAGVAALSWGTPHTWRAYDDYEPGLSQRARVPTFLGTSLFVGLVVVIIFGLAGLELFWGIVVGGLATLFLALLLTGAIADMRRRKREEGALLPEVPDKLKAAILFPAWFVSALVIYAILTFAFPALVALNAVVGITVGFVATFALLESSYFKELRDTRAARRALAEARDARRREVLGLPPKGAKKKRAKA